MFRLTKRFVIALAAILLFSASSLASAQSDAPVRLFTNLTTREVVTVADEASRIRLVEVNPDALGLNTNVVESISFDLFADVPVTAILDEMRRNPSGSVLWSGKVAGDETSHVNFVVRDGIMMGAIAMGLEKYEVRVSPEGVQYIMQVDAARFDESEADFIPVAGESVTPQRSANRGIDDGSIIDVIVGYTPEARAAVGTVAAIESLIELAMQETNIGYANSNVSQRVMLVHMFETADSENGNSTSALLGQWRATSDGRFDEIHALRDTYHGDFAHLITEVSGCGVAYLQTTPNDANFEDDAFGVTTYSCATGNYTYGHELGHNMGLRHDWYVDHDTTPFSYAHGFTNYADSWRTVMAYNNRCSAASGSCSRLLYFSNPNVTYNGDPMGVAGTTPATCIANSTIPEPESCVANNASVLQSQNATNSQFRISQITWTGAADDDWNNAANWDIVQGAANRSSGASSTTVNRVPLSIDDVVIPTGLATYPTISSGSMTAREVVIETGATLNMTDGTLTVTGTRWEEQGTGQFNGTGGTVIFDSPLDQSVMANAASTFNDVQFGNGNAQSVMVASDLDIDGNLTISTGATVDAGSYTIEVAGNWDDQASGFSADTSTIIFDGTTQSVDKVTTKTLISEDFSAYPTCGCTTAAPAGWARSGDGFAFLFGNSTAYHWHDSTDAWLFTQAVQLQAGVNYTFSFDHLKGGGSTSTITAAYGLAQNSAAMSTTIGDLTNAEITTSFQNAQFSFTVATSGTYYLGIHSTQTSFYNRLDNISLIGSQDLTFYDLQVASGEADFVENVVINNNLQTDANAIADFGANDVSVEGTVTNNGTIRQTKDVSGVGVLVEFGRIQNAAGTVDKYYGADITPTSAAFGSTTVDIQGNGTCSVTAGTVTNTIDRCHEITPTTNGQPATVRFYYHESEINGQTFDTLQIWHWNGSSWDGPIGSPTYGDSTNGDADWNWIDVTGISDFSPFAVGNAAPTAVTLESFTATAQANGTVILDWETAQEVNHAGFNILRRATNSREAWTQINESLIASTGSQAQGATYQFTDTTVTAGTWDYLLEDVENDGDTFQHVDFVASAEVQTPTTVTLANNDTHAPSILLYSGLLLLMLVTTRLSLKKR